MKYIKFIQGRGIYHLSLTNAKNHEGVLKYDCDPYHDVTYCEGNHSSLTEIFDYVPTGKLCERCKKKFIRNFGEEALFMEIL